MRFRTVLPLLIMVSGCADWPALAQWFDWPVAIMKGASLVAKSACIGAGAAIGVFCIFIMAAMADKVLNRKHD